MSDSLDVEFFFQLSVIWIEIGLNRLNCILYNSYILLQDTEVIELLDKASIVIHVAKCPCQLAGTLCQQTTRITDFSISLCCEAHADDEKVRRDRQEDLEIAAALMKASWFESALIYQVDDCLQVMNWNVPLEHSNSELVSNQVT